MAWLRIDDRVRTHPKVVKAGPAAAWLWFCGICYCREHLTDGLIPKVMLNTLAPGLTSTKACAKRLVEVGLWHDGSEYYEVHDFLDWNPKRDDIEASREWDRRRKELYTQPGLVEEVRARDQDRCRYCGTPVNWKDRRGPIGGQYDHVIPRGENTASNIVVACRSCNFKKGGRTPDEAGITLLPVLNQNGTSSGLSRGPSSGSESGSSSLSRDRAGDAGLGSGSGYSGGDTHQHDPEESARETTPEPPRPGPLVERARDWGVRHGGHVTGFCAWMCLFEDQFNQFVQRITARGVAEPEARDQVRRWAEQVRDVWGRDHTPTGKPWDFWNARWEAEHGSSNQGPRGFDPLAGVKEFINRG